jgi:hypothetical protein
MHLLSKGYNVKILPNRISPNKESRWEYVDDGDLELVLRGEVKHKPDIDFKSADEMPYLNLIVDEVYKIEKKHKSSLFGYFIVNASGTGFIFVPGWTQQYWFKERHFDKREQEERNFYMVGKEHVKYYVINQ